MLIILYIVSFNVFDVYYDFIFLKKKYVNMVYFICWDYESVMLF